MKPSVLLTLAIWTASAQFASGGSDSVARPSPQDLVTPAAEDSAFPQYERLLHERKR